MLQALLVAVAMLVLSALPAAAQVPTRICAAPIEVEASLDRNNPGIRRMRIGGGDVASVVRAFNAEPAAQAFTRLFFFKDGCLVVFADVERRWLGKALGEGI